MINAQEFRIGNLVEQGIIVSVKENTARVEYELDGARKYSFVDYYDLMPIELTEERLLKLGFTKNKHGYYELQNGFTLLNTKPEIGGYLYSVMLIDEVCIVHYLHQLQNLYFSLTGKELQLSQNTKS